SAPLLLSLHLSQLECTGSRGEEYCLMERTRLLLFCSLRAPRSALLALLALLQRCCGCPSLTAIAATAATAAPFSLVGCFFVLVPRLVALALSAVLSVAPGL